MGVGPAIVVLVFVMSALSDIDIGYFTVNSDLDTVFLLLASSCIYGH